MTTLSSLIAAPTLLEATAKKSSSSSSSELPFLIIIAVFAAVYFLFLRPRQQRAKAQTAKGKAFEIGDEVMSVGGIYGRVVGLNDDSVEVEVAPDVVLTFLRRAVNPRPVSAMSSSTRDDVAPDDDPDRPFGGSSYGNQTSFGASSGHFGDDDGEDFDDTDDFDGTEDFDDTDFDEGPAGAGDDGADEEEGHGAADGSATGTPRTTGGPSSEDD